MLMYERAELADAPAITRMYETYLNEGPSIADYVRQGLEDPRMVCIKCVDTDTGALVGIIGSRPGPEFTYPHPELEEEIKARWGPEGIYSSDVMIVNPAYRGRGVSRELTVQLREGLKAVGARAIAMELWIRPDGEIPALRSARHLGEAVVVARSEDFYRDLARYGLRCPVCGSHCRCGALIAVVDFRQDGEEKSHEGTA